jgi:hypothetical protein
MMLSGISSRVRRCLAVAALFTVSTAVSYHFHVPPAGACRPIGFCIDVCLEDFRACQDDCAVKCGRYTPGYDIACDNACSRGCYDGERQCLRDCACVF